MAQSQSSCAWSAVSPVWRLSRVTRTLPSSDVSASMTFGSSRRTSATTAPWARPPCECLDAASSAASAASAASAPSVDASGDFGGVSASASAALAMAERACAWWRWWWRWRWCCCALVLLARTPRCTCRKSAAGAWTRLGVGVSGMRATLVIPTTHRLKKTAPFPKKNDTSPNKTTTAVVVVVVVVPKGLRPLFFPLEVSRRSSPCRPPPCRPRFAA